MMSLTLPVVPVTETLSVPERLTQLRTWSQLYREEDFRLHRRAQQLNPTRLLDVQKGAQIAAQRRRLRLQSVAEPIEMPPELLRQPDGFTLLTRSLRQQFSQLNREDRILWLHNLLFIMTPALRHLDNKIARVRTHLRFGQQRNFLLGDRQAVAKQPIWTF